MEITLKNNMEMSEENVHVFSDSQERGMSSKYPKKQRLMDKIEEIPVKFQDLSPKPILGLDYTEEIPLQEAFIGVLRSKKDIGIAIGKITSILPGFRHLKRCSGDRLLLAFLRPLEDPQKPADTSFASAEDLKTFLTSSNFPLDLLQENFELLSVPTRPSRTRAQYIKASKSWPQNFHPDAQIEALVTGKFFNSSQLEIIESCMRICIKAAEISAIGNEYCNGSIVILNPNDEGISRILAVSTSRVNEHPMWHAAMLGIDLIAKMRGGGAWKLQTSDNRSLFYPKELKNLEIPEFGGFEVNKDADNDDKTPYLCTNYWVFLLKEPCALCAMALLHSRVSMIFYGAPNCHGVLGTKTLLHTLPNLNHRYKVWSGILENECKIATEKLIEIRT